MCAQYVGGVLIHNDEAAAFMKEVGFVPFGIDEEVIANSKTHRIGKYGAWNHDKTVYYINENYPYEGKGRKKSGKYEPIAPGKWVEEGMFFLRGWMGESTDHQAFLMWMKEQRAQHKRIIFRCIIKHCDANAGKGICYDKLVNHGGTCPHRFRTEWEKKAFEDKQTIGVEKGIWECEQPEELKHDSNDPL
jgi:hypothetical protein